MQKPISVLKRQCMKIILPCLLLLVFLPMESFATTNPRYDLAAGALFKVKASDVGIEGGYLHKPQFIISDGPLGTKLKKIRVLEYDNESATCLFQEKILAGQYSLSFVSGSGKNKRILPVSDSFYVHSPIIYLSSSEKIEAGDVLTLGGVYFGDSPKITLEFMHGDKTLKKRCALEKKLLKNFNSREKASVMDCLSSQSYISIKVPKGITEITSVKMTLESPHGSVEKNFNVQDALRHLQTDSRVEMKVPSITERVFAEKRDFYVFGTINKDLVKIPGDIKVEIFKKGSDIALRTIVSSVNPETGTSPDSSIYKDYPEGEAKGLDVAPDLMKAPEDFLFPGNKLLVTNDYFSAMVQGGLTKDFDTSYKDSDGNLLTDLSRGEYIVKVTGISGDLEGYNYTVDIYFEPMRKIFGAFRPDNHKAKFFEYARDNCLRRFWDPFVGHFLIPADNFGGGIYRINKRYRPQNAYEAVNFLDSVNYGTDEDAQVTYVLYNLDRSSYTQKLEVASVLKANLTGTKRTQFIYYDIGEPSLSYVPASTDKAEKISIDGRFRQFKWGDNLNLTRAEIFDYNPEDHDNQCNLESETPMIIDLSPEDGLELALGDEISIYGVVPPIPTTVTAITDPHSEFFYSADNYIQNIRYTISSRDESEKLETKIVNLGRKYTTSQENYYYSGYEFKHDFHLEKKGRYVFELQVMDKNGAEIAGGSEKFTVIVK